MAKKNWKGIFEMTMFHKENHDLKATMSTEIGCDILNKKEMKEFMNHVVETGKEQIKIMVENNPDFQEIFDHVDFEYSIKVVEKT